MNNLFIKMDDSNLYNELSNANEEKPNKFEENWGTLLNFLDNSEIDETTISKSTGRNLPNQSFLQEHKLESESRNVKRPKNMAEIYDSNKLTMDRSRVLSSNRSFESPEVNYVYRPLK